MGIFASKLWCFRGAFVVVYRPLNREGFIITAYPTKDIKRLLERRAVKDLMAAAHIAHVGCVIKEKASRILVSEGIERKEAERVGFKYAESPQEAINQALAKYGRDSRVAILHQAQHILPRIGYKST